MGQSFGGFSKPSKNRSSSQGIVSKPINVAGYTINSSNSFSNTYPYSDIYFYSGLLNKNGSSYVISGSYSSGDSYVTTQDEVGTTSDPSSYPATIYYSSGGYSGTLYKSGSTSVGSGQYTVQYTGTVSSPGYDTRVYRQDYTGFAYLGGQKIKYRRSLLC